MQFGFKTLKPECHFDLGVVGEDTPYVSDDGVDWVAHAAIIGYSIMVGVSNALLVNR